MVYLCEVNSHFFPFSVTALVIIQLLKCELDFFCCLQLYEKKFFHVDRTFSCALLNSNKIFLSYQFFIVMCFWCFISCRISLVLTCVFGFTAYSLSPFIVNLLTTITVWHHFFSVLFSHQGLVVKVWTTLFWLNSNFKFFRRNWMIIFLWMENSKVLPKCSGNHW